LKFYPLALRFEHNIPHDDGGIHNFKGSFYNGSPLQLHP
jgi:hypothetical protein